MPTVISEKVIVNAPGADVCFDGVDFTGNGYLEVATCKSLTIKNCRIYRLSGEIAAKTYWLKITQDDEMKLVIENCFFGDSPKGSVGRVYNMIEPYCKMVTGSSWSNNWFTTESCGHNGYNVYNMAEGATLNINGNYFEHGDRTCRIGIKGEPKCTVNMKNNTMKDLCNDPAWDCFILVQPYGKQTTTFKNLTINLAGNKSAATQEIIACYNPTDLILTAENLPTVYVNDELYVPTILE